MRDQPAASVGPDTAGVLSHAPDLPHLARSGELESLEKLWLEEMTSPGEMARYVETLHALVETGQTERASVLAAMLVEALDTSGRGTEILSLLDDLASLELVDVSGVGEICAKQLRSECGSEPWFQFMLDKAGVSLEGFTWDSWLAFHRCAAFLPGKVVRHRSGWGEGKIDALYPERDEVEILFASGKRHTVPWHSAVETMDPLPAWDVRAMRISEPEALLRLVETEPIEILRRALKVVRGRSDARQLKELLRGSVVPERSWATWWKKAKAAAIEDPWIAVEGSATRPTFALRKKALTLCEEARLALRHETRIAETLMVLRAYLDRVTRDADRADLAEFAQERLGDIAASGEPDADRVQALLFLEELGLGQEDQAARATEAYLRGGTDTGAMQEPDFRRLVDIPDPKLRCRIVRMIPGIFGDGWHRSVAGQLRRIPDDCEDSLELLVDLIREQPDHSVLLDVHEAVAPFPARHAFLIYLLTKAYAEKAFDSAGRRLDRNIVCRVIMHVLRIVSDARSGRGRRSRLQSRIMTLLIGKKGLLDQLLAEVEEATMASVLKVARGGGEDFPQKVQDLVERRARDRFPDLGHTHEQAFWEDDSVILCTRPGFKAREREFHHLRDELIPRNSASIAAARAHGDLSENAEWEAALEEQRTLTARGSEYEAELKRARFLEQCDIPDELVAPGTRVRLLDLDRNEEKTQRILGPWDTVLGDDVVSYLAPLAAGLLGKHRNDVAEIELPNGSRRIRVLDIAPLF